MRKTMMCAAVLCATAGATALYAVPAGAVQPSAPLALKSAATQNVETVRSRHYSRWYGSRWYGAAGAYAYAPRYRYGYGAYAYDPYYRPYYGPRVRVGPFGFGVGFGRGYW